MRREHADAAAAADLVFLVEQIDHVEACGESFPAEGAEILRQAGVDLRVGWYMPAIGNDLTAGQSRVFAQSRAEDHVGIEERVAPFVGRAGGRRERLLVIEMYIVVLDVGECGGSKLN